MAPRATGLLLVLLAGCPRDSAQGDERLLDKLRALPPEGNGPASPYQDLQRAVGRPAAAQKLKLPAATARLGPVTLEVTEATAVQRLASPGVTLTSQERFLKVTLEARAEGPAELALGEARLEQLDQVFELAPDVQKLLSGSPKVALLQPGPGQALVLYFEVPPAAIAPGLKLVLPSDGGAVELPLQ